MINTHFVAENIMSPFIWADLIPVCKSEEFKREEVFKKKLKSWFLCSDLKPQSSTLLRLRIFTHFAGSNCQELGLTEESIYCVCWQTLGLQILPLIPGWVSKKTAKTKGKILIKIYIRTMREVPSWKLGRL